MGKLVIQDECLAPEKYVYLTYSGPDPWGVVKKIADSLKGFFHVSSSGVCHARLNWDIASDPIAFWSLWWVKRKMSGNSTAVVYIWVQGTKSKTDNTGQFTLRLHSELRTRASGPSIILKPFWLTYSYLFYDRVRRRYIETCRNLVLNFRNEIKEHYNLGKTSVPQAHSSFGNW
ncbi:MAG: hypothetical protein ISS93_01785 [Candidatus Aenigmarchaeota archaeon]|nr:hypothetical protein [Candidatus Aenigmarchaeota archaeon]